MDWGAGARFADGLDVDDSRAGGKIDGMGQGTSLLVLCVLALGAGCATDDLSLLEFETVRFKDENERIRQEDLLARYEKRKRQADALSAKLLEIQQQREEAYAAYDELRGDLVKVERQRSAAERDRAAAQKALASARAETKRLSEELKKERAAIAQLKADLEEMQAQLRALEQKKARSAKVEE